MIVAGEYALELPEFSVHADAEKTLFAQRDKGLKELHAVSSLSPNLDYSAESLKLIEHWFFESRQPVATESGYSMRHAIGFYFGEVLCRANQFHWVVQEFAFAQRRYEIGVQRALTAIMLTKGKLPQVAGNKKMQSLWREAQRYAP